MKAKNYSRYFSLLVVSVSCLLSRPIFADVKAGESAFKANCAACHQKQSLSTGPSLVYIRDTYPKQAQQAFFDWVKAPGKKNPDLIQMPPMPYLDQTTLSHIHDYILFVSQHLQVAQAKPKFVPYKPPKKSFPYIKRGYFPFTSPASISIALNADMAVMWDPVIAKVRYVYPTWAPFNGEKKRDENRPQVLYWESSEQGLSINQHQQVDFKGYEWREGSPEFIYQIGGAIVREQITQGSTARSFTRHYKIEGATSAVTLNLASQGGASISSSAGKLMDGMLTLSADESKSFSIEVAL